MEFRHLRYFLVLAEELHFGRAAQRLSISQPPLSTNIQQLEASVGARLFTRNSKAVQLTEAGRAFVPQARALLEQAQQAARHARDVADGLAGSLQVGFVGTMLYRGLPVLLKRFQAQHPKLRLTLKELSSSEQLIELTNERLDLGFVHTTRVPPGLAQVLVASQPFVACLPADHALAGKRKLPLSALYNQGGDPSLYIVDAAGELSLKPVKVKSYESSSVVISGGVEEGASVVVLGVQKLDPAQKVRVVSSLSF